MTQPSTDPFTVPPASAAEPSEPEPSDVLLGVPEPENGEWVTVRAAASHYRLTAREIRTACKEDRLRCRDDDGQFQVFIPGEE